MLTEVAMFQLLGTVPESEPETSVRDLAQQLHPSLTLLVGIQGTDFGTVA